MEVLLLRPPASAPANKKFFLPRAVTRSLEALHLASEDHDEAATRKLGAAYLATARTLAP